MITPHLSTNRLQAWILASELLDSTGAPIVFPKTILANTSLLTDVIDGRGHFGIQLFYKDDSAAGRLRAWWRVVGLSDGADMVDNDGASNNSTNTGETLLTDTTARNKWVRDVQIDTINYDTVGILGLGFFRLRFASKTNGAATVIKSIDAFYLNSR